MHPKNSTPTFALVTLTLALTAGCSRTGIPSPADLPIVYKIDVQQGNLVTQDMLAQLEPGMDKTKVKYVMGTPLVTDTFHADRWDYIYTMQERGGRRTQRRVSLFFTDGKLARVEGNVKPAAGAIAPSAEAQATTVEVPEAEKSLVEKMKGTVSGDEQESGGKAAATEPAATAAVDGGTAESVAAEVGGDQGEAAGEGSEFAVDNDVAAGRSAESGGEAAARGDPLLPRFQAESDLENAVLTDEAPPAEPPAVAAEAATGADATTEEGGGAAGGKGDTGAATEVTIPDDAPKPPKKGFFRRILEKVGVGDNEGGEYESADPKYRDPSDPETQ